MRHNHRHSWLLALPCLVAVMMITAPALAQVTYSFTGEPFTHADPPYTLGDRIVGSVELAGVLPPLMPLTDIAALLLDFTFTDGIQTRVSGNTNVCTFEVATDAVGNIVHWYVSLRQSPFPGAGNPVQAIDLVGPIPGPGYEQGGEGPAPAVPCGNTSLTTYATSSSAGSWVTIQPVAAAIPAITPAGAVVLAILLAIAAMAAIRIRSV